MSTRLSRHFVWALVLAVISSGAFLVTATAQEQPIAGISSYGDWKDPGYALSTLQKAHASDASTFVEQAELDCLIVSVRSDPSW